MIVYGIGYSLLGFVLRIVTLNRCFALDNVRQRSNMTIRSTNSSRLYTISCTIITNAVDAGFTQTSLLLTDFKRRTNGLIIRCESLTVTREGRTAQSSRSWIVNFIAFNVVEELCLLFRNGGPFIVDFVLIDYARNWLIVVILAKCMRPMSAQTHCTIWISIVTIISSFGLFGDAS